MLKFFNKLKWVLLSLSYSLIISAPAIADDIEIYKNSAQYPANVLFLLDTSGSMNVDVQSRPDYDPTHDYTDPSNDACFDKNKIYFQGSNLALRRFGCTTNTTPESTRQVHKSKFVCDNGMPAINQYGFYDGRFSQYRVTNGTGKWESRFWPNQYQDDYIECEADAGVHGRDNVNPNVWASDTNGPWSSASADTINWASSSSGVSWTAYDGNYFNYWITAPLTNEGTRITVMKNTLTSVLNNMSDVNVGLSRLDYDGYGGMVMVPVKLLDSTHRAHLNTELGRMRADGSSTPLAEAFYESVMYMKGGKVDYGDGTGPFLSQAPTRIGNNLSSDTYDSPIVDECQNNFIVVLTDGYPNTDELDTTRLANVDIVADCNSRRNGNGNFNSASCLDEIATSIGSHDQNASLPGDQVISTFTIGFAVNSSLLADTAQNSFNETGIGKYYLANNTSQLADTFTRILDTVKDANATMNSAAVSVNAFNRSVHLDDLYFTLFKSSGEPNWNGNLKKYKLGFFVDTQDVDNDNDITEELPFIKDANHNHAIVSGFFSDTAQSFWSATADGGDITKGGAASNLADNRNVYTFTGRYNNTDGVFSPSRRNPSYLFRSLNKVDVANNRLNNVTLPLSSTAEIVAGTPRRDSVIDWAAGKDVLDTNTDGDITDARKTIGDVLHSEPALVQYGGTAAAPDLVSYVATNNGYLHAIDVDDGKEIFSFIPQELLKNLDTAMNGSATIDKLYGLDGNVVPWVYDDNNNGKIEPAQGDHVYLYFGMRRGGNNIYSLDVTNRNKPELRWVIKGGNGAYAKLGQTWSTPNVEKIKIKGVETTVLIFGGGYDTAQDNKETLSADARGNAVYIADEKTGKLLWSSSNSNSNLNLAEMKYSIPARIKPLDLKGDGFIDRLYVADTGGQIFRFDIDNNSSSALSSSIKGGRIANISDGTKPGARRFYYPPDVAIIAPKGKIPYLAIGIGSGYRAHPLNQVIQDRIYLFKDRSVFAGTTNSYTTLTESDLYDATLNLAGGNGNASQQGGATTDLRSKDGWYIKLNENNGSWIGEKVLAEPLFIEGHLIVTTYIPDTTVAATGCGVGNIGAGRAYFLDAIDATASYPDTADDRKDRYDTLEAGIPPAPNVIITKEGVPTIGIGTDVRAADIAKGLRKTHWYEVEK